MLLEELLGKVLEVTLGELLVGGDGDLGIITTDNGHLVSEATSATLDLDAVVKELLESSGIKDLVTGGTRAVDGELVGDLLVSLLLYPMRSTWLEMNGLFDQSAFLHD